MGTNYYWRSKSACPACGRLDPPKHIGKSSGGWCFSLHVEPDEGIHDLGDWERLWASGGEIRNEYGDVVSVEDMRLIIMARASHHDEAPASYAGWAEFHRLNQSEHGPAGLLRNAISSRCIKHGAGTWDCITGEFS